MALETASDSDTYLWRIETDQQPFRREVVFEQRSYDSIAPAEMHRAVTQALDEIDPAAILIHSYSTPDARAALLWCRRHRRVAVCMAESRSEDARRVGYREVIKRMLVSQFDAALSSGSDSTRYFTSLGLPPGRIFLGYSVVDNAYFAEAAARVRTQPESAAVLPGLRDPRPFFLASARFMRRKNLDTLLRAFARYERKAKQEGEDSWRLILIGDGELRAELEAIAAREAIEHLEMPGWRQIEDIPNYYGLASAFVHTAEVDQWGLVVNEAMAAGLPVIVSTGTGAAADLVENGRNGFTFDPHDEDRLAACLWSMAHEVDREAFAEASVDIVGRWPLEMFGRGLIQAVEAGRASAQRGSALSVTLLIQALRFFTRSPRAMHSVQD